MTFSKGKIAHITPLQSKFSAVLAKAIEEDKSKLNPKVRTYDALLVDCDTTENHIRIQQTKRTVGLGRAIDLNVWVCRAGSKRSAEGKAALVCASVQ